MAHYWNEETEFRSNVGASLTWPLRESLHNGDDVMLVGHSFGTLVAYDVLWEFCYTSEHEEVRDAKATHFVLLGSPLGNPTVQERLKGGRLKGPRDSLRTSVSAYGENLVKTKLAIFRTKNSQLM